MTRIHLQRVCFDLKVYSNEVVVKHEHYLAHRSVQAPFHGAGVVESTVM